MEAARPTFHNLSPEKQERVLSAALGEFSDKGYQQASVNTMVSASGIAKGSIYQYFKDKKSLFLYIFDFAIGMVRRTLLAVKEETRDEDFFVRLEKSLVAGVAFIQRHPRVYGLYLKILFDQHVPRRRELLRRCASLPPNTWGRWCDRARNGVSCGPTCPRPRRFFSWTRFWTASSRPPRCRPSMSPWAWTGPAPRTCEEGWGAGGDPRGRGWRGQ